MPNDPDPSDIREFLAALVSRTRPNGIPRKLTHLAEAVARHHELPRADADDLVAELLRRLVENDMRQVRDDLAEFDNADLERVLGFRLRQIATERRPRWKLMRALRGHLKVALGLGLPAAGLLPMTLEESSRFKPELVARAAACFAADGVPASVDGLAPVLMKHYFGTDGSDDEAVNLVSHTPGPDVLVELSHDAQVAAAGLRRSLNERQRSIIQSTREGRSLTNVATEERVAVSTAHAWREAATGTLGAVARQLELDRHTVEHALDLLEAA